MKQSEDAYNATDEPALEKLRDSRDKKRERELKDIEDVLKIPSGVRFFSRLLAEGHVFQTTFRTNSQSFFLEGQRNMALKFLHDLQLVATREQLATILLPVKDKED